MSVYNAVHIFLGIFLCQPFLFLIAQSRRPPFRCGFLTVLLLPLPLLSQLGMPIWDRMPLCILYWVCYVLLYVIRSIVVVYAMAVSCDPLLNVTAAFITSMARKEAERSAKLQGGTRKMSKIKNCSY